MDRPRPATASTQVVHCSQVAGAGRSSGTICWRSCCQRDAPAARGSAPAASALALASRAALAWALPAAALPPRVRAAALAALTVLVLTVPAAAPPVLAWR